MKLTRRQIVATAAGSVVAMNALAQSSQPAPTNADFAKQAQDGVQRNRETLTKLEIPMSTEPAFQFKA